MPKKIPMRTCIGCGMIRPKKELIRIVLRDDGTVQADRTGRAPGRGAYLCDDQACLQKAVKKKSFARAFRTQVPQEAFDQLNLQIGQQDTAARTQPPEQAGSRLPQEQTT